ncbi:hypothetical protein Tco_0527144 [Tanacetum coccineum]
MSRKPGSDGISFAPDIKKDTWSEDEERILVEIATMLDTKITHTSSNESSDICSDPKSSFDMKPLMFCGNSQYGFASSSPIFHIKDPKSSTDLHPLGFSGNSQYEIATIPHDENSHLYLKQEDFLQPQLAPDVYMSYLLEGATTLSNLCDYGYYEDTKRDLMFESVYKVSVRVMALHQMGRKGWIL